MWRGLVFVGVLGCAAGQVQPEPVQPQSARPESVQPQPVQGGLLQRVPNSGPTSAGPEAQPVCRTLPEPASPQPAAKGRCAAVANKLQTELRPRLERDYRPSAPGARLTLRYDCDPVGAPWELVFETGTGHGHGLALVRLRWQDGKIQALRLARVNGADGGVTTVERAVIEATQVDRALPVLRGLLAVQLAEQAPESPHGGSGHESSASWHGLVRLSDAAGHVRERGYTGAGGGSTQVDSIPVAEITAVLRPLLEAAADEDARAFFVSRFIAAGPGQAAWWVKERLVDLAADVGTPALIPRLVRLAQEVRVDASVKRTRGQAVAAVARLAMFDARIDERGMPVPLEQAITIYAHACLP